MELGNCKEIVELFWKVELLLYFYSYIELETFYKLIGKTYLIPQGKLKDSANNKSPR